MVRHYHVTIHAINNYGDTEVWWVTLPGLLSYIHKIVYHTGDVVFFNIHGDVDGCIAENVNSFL